MMTDSIIKSLKWLIFNFPEIENPKDDADKTSNYIHLYCQNAVDELNRQKSEIEQKDIEINLLIKKKEAAYDEVAELKAEVERLKSDLEFREKQLYNLIQEMDGGEYGN